MLTHSPSSRASSAAASVGVSPGAVMSHPDLEDPFEPAVLVADVLHRQPERDGPRLAPGERVQRPGDPFWTDRYTDVEVIGAYGPLERQSSVQFDVWYYNFGRHQLMRRLLFRDGVLLREETLGYGVDEIGDDCDPDRMPDGLSVGELVARCGEPASRRSQYDAIVRRPIPGVEQWRDQRREQWVYDFGDSRFVSIVTLSDGHVSGVERVQR